MAKPFRITFQLSTGAIFAEASINRSTGDFYYFPKYQKFISNNYDHLRLKPSYDAPDICHDPIDHISWHKDGKLHIKHQSADRAKKTLMNPVECDFLHFNEKTILPLFSHSIRDHEGNSASIIAIIAGNKIIQNLNLLPKPYSRFIVKGKKNNHIQSVTNGSEQKFGYTFFNLPFFVPITDNLTKFSVTLPLQEDQLKEAADTIAKNEGGIFLKPMEIRNLKPIIH